MSKIHKMEIINRIKKNPIVDGIVMQYEKLIIPAEEAEAETYEVTTLYIVYNTDAKYIKRVTGEDFFGESDLMSTRITKLHFDRIGYEGAVDSPDIVPGPMQLHSEVNMGAANMCAREMEHLSSNLGIVREKEKSIFKKYVDSNMENLNMNIELLKMLDDNMHVTTTTSHNFDEGDYFDGKRNYQNIVLFDRFNEIKLITETEREKKKRKAKVVKFRGRFK